MMYEEDRENRNNSEAGYNDRNDEHMEYRSEASRKEENQEVRSEQHLTQESSQSSSAWQSAPQDNSQNSGAWQSAPQGSSQNSSAWQSAPQNSGRATGENGAAAWNTQNSQTADQDRAASWNAQASAQDSSLGTAQTGVPSCFPPETGTHKTQRPQHGRKNCRCYRGSSPLWYSSRWHHVCSRYGR